MHGKILPTGGHKALAEGLTRFRNRYKDNNHGKKPTRKQIAEFERAFCALLWEAQRPVLAVRDGETGTGGSGVPAVHGPGQAGGASDERGADVG